MIAKLKRRVTDMDTVMDTDMVTVMVTVIVLRKIRVCSAK